MCWEGQVGMFGLYNQTKILTTAEKDNLLQAGREGGGFEFYKIVKVISNYMIIARST